MSKDAWLNPSLNRAEIQRRLESVICRKMNGFYRSWKHYLWCRNMVDSEVIYGSDWMNLRVGKAYLVIVDEENTHYEDTWDLAGNVMVFQKYEKLDAKTIAARQSTVDVLLDSLKQLRDSYDSDDSTYTEGGDEDTLYQLGQARRMIKKYCHMENYQFHFWDVRNKTMHIIDPCAERRGRIEILDLASSGWDINS